MVVVEDLFELGSEQSPRRRSLTLLFGRINHQKMKGPLRILVITTYTTSYIQ